ncbi:GntR family transcriptional regulator [Streptomyces akebiae]|uniref:UTRA domain-containing protein n=1 Tax=Streptomyces akebiae TaxID=2865673 RepID=A0ABX8XUH9_9ACTN|nr:UTRA domain-containing protein [Streptomyces akebiae]QYX79275.1 UTRA domain-containing protein [Streptomyces akebiae]
MSENSWVSTSMPYLTSREKGQGDAWGADAAAQGRRGTQRILYAGEVQAPAEVARLLGLAEGETVVVRRRLILLDDQPNEVTDTYFPVRIARGTGLAGTAKIPGGAVTLLARLGHVGALVREDVTADNPDDEERETLRTAPGEPVLRLTRVTLDRDDRPIQVDRMVMPARRQRLRYEIAIDNGVG